MHDGKRVISSFKAKHQAFWEKSIFQHKATKSGYLKEISGEKIGKRRFLGGFFKAFIVCIRYSSEFGFIISVKYQKFYTFRSAKFGN